MIEISRKFSFAAAIFVALFIAATPAEGSGLPQYYPSGPQQNVSKQALLEAGWTLCWEGLYSGQAYIPEIQASCTGEFLAYAGGQANSDTYMLFAAGQRSVMFSETGYNQVLQDNGTYWYYNSSSMGFSNTDSIQQSSADVSDLSNNLKLSWHTGHCGADMICGGWRVGSKAGLNGSNSYERAIWQYGGAYVAPKEEAVIVPAVSQEEYDSLQAQYDELFASHELLQSEYDSVYAELQIVEAEYGEYVSYSDLVISGYAQMQIDYEITIGEQSSEIEQYKSIIDTKNASISGYIKRVDSLEESIAAKQATITDLSNKLKSSNETIEMLRSTLTSTQDSLKSVKDDLVDVNVELAKTKTDYELEKAKSNDLNKQLIAAQARIKELEAKLADVESRLKEMTAKQGTTKKQLDDATARIETLVQQLKDANATISEQRGKIEQLQAIADNPDATQNLALAEEVKGIAIAKFATAEKDSEEYDLALSMLAVAAKADDPDLPEELAAIPVLGNVANEVLNVMNNLGNIGADIAPDQRERAEEIVVASVIAGNIAVSAGASAPSGGARRKL